MANAYWVRKVNTRERLNRTFTRLTGTWAYTKEQASQRFGRTTYRIGAPLKLYHVIPTPDPKKEPSRYNYISFERQRWHEAGSPMRGNKTRKICQLCKKRIPVPIRVLFELEGKVNV